MQRRGYIGFAGLLLVATFFMGSAFPAGKYLIGSEDVPPLFLAGCRFTCAGIVLLSFCALRRGPASILPAAWGSVLKGFAVVLLVGVLQTTTPMGLLNLSLQHIDASLASVLFFTNPLWVLLLAHVLKIDAITGRRVVGTALGITGIVLCMDIHSSGLEIALVLPLLGALSWAVCTIVTTSFFKFDRSPFILAGWQMLLGGGTLLSISFVLGQGFPENGISNIGVFSFLWIALPASVGAFGLWFLALSKGGPAFTSSFLFLAPLFASLLSVVFLGETLSTNFLLGGSLVFAAIYLVNSKRKKSKASPADKVKRPVLKKPADEEV